MFLSIYLWLGCNQRDRLRIAVISRQQTRHSKLSFYIWRQCVFWSHPITHDIMYSVFFPSYSNICPAGAVLLTYLNNLSWQAGRQWWRSTTPKTTAREIKRILQLWRVFKFSIYTEANGAFSFDTRPFSSWVNMSFIVQVSTLKMAANTQTSVRQYLINRRVYFSRWSALDWEHCCSCTWCLLNLCYFCDHGSCDWNVKEQKNTRQKQKSCFYLWCIHSQRDVCYARLCDISMNVTFYCGEDAKKK